MLHSAQVRVGLMALAVLAVGGSLALGQRRVGSDGRALDANPSTTTQTNSIENQIDFAARNAIITGNVPGGRGFRGDVGYSAPTDFRGRIGSDDLFGFRSESIGSSLPVVQSGQRFNLDANTVFVPRSLGSSSYLGGVDLIQANVTTGPAGASFNAAQIAAETARIIPAPTTSVQIYREPSGDVLGVSASPLLGLRQLEPQRLRLPSIETLPDDSERSRLRLDPIIEPTPAELNLDTRWQDQALQRRPIDRQALEDQQLGAALMNPGLVLGQQLYAGRVGVDQKTLDQQVQDLERAMFRPLGSRTAEPGADVYMDLLAAMRGDRELPQKKVDDAGKALPTLKVPTIEELEEAEQQRQQALRAAAQAAEDPQRPGQTPPGEEPRQNGEAREPEPALPGAARPESLEELLARFGSVQDLPRVATLAGDRDNRINRMMRDAEADLAAGKFYDAEAKYRQVLTDAPDTPLAMAGQIHAQLGAAMLKSAAFNLRRLFEQHPELIAVRYDPRLLPPQKRLEFVHNQIMQELQSSPRPGDALVLAYLGHQLDSRQLVRYGLAIARAKSPRDPLLPLLERFWLTERQADAPRVGPVEPDADRSTAPSSGGDLAPDAGPPPGRPETQPQ